MVKGSVCFPARTPTFPEVGRKPEPFPLARDPEFPVPQSRSYHMRISNRFEKHVLTAVAAAASVAGAANSAVVTWNCNLVIPANVDGLYINVETQQTGTAGSSVPGWDINPYGASALTWFNATGTGMLRYPGVTSGSAGNLAGLASFSVSASGSYGSGSVTFGSAAGNWTFNSVNVFGFRFTAADNLTHYGYGLMQVGATSADRTLLTIYYESVAGVAIPAPGALALLGAAGLAGRRRRA